MALFNWKENMNNINKILLHIASNDGRIFKENVIKENRDNELLKRVCEMALNPFTNYYIKNIPQFSCNSIFHDKISLSDALDKLSDLSSRKYTGHAGIQYLKDILSSLDHDDAEVIIKVIRRDLRCGINVATVNKVWEGLIPVYPCLLCSPYDKKIIKKITWPAYGQLKEDGLRFNAIVSSNVCEFYSRKGSLIELKDNSLAEEFIRIANGEDLVFDGELVAYKNGILLPRKEGNGIANKAIKGTITREESQLLCGVLWDVIPLQDFKKGSCNITYKERFEKLNNLLKTAYSDECLIINTIKYNFFKKIDIVKTQEVASLEDALELFGKYTSSGLEGIIIKNKNSLWENARSKEQIKLKSEKVCELRVVGYNYGTVGTKNEHRLGSLQCSSEDGKILVNISGFSDEERDTIKENEVLGKIVSVLYNERITKKYSSVDSLFLPRIVEFREDKDIADFSKDIK